jgi:prevent-host-death family protein
MINAKTLRNELRAVMERVRKGERFTVLYRSRPVCRIVPVDAAQVPAGQLEEDSLYQAKALGSSQDGMYADDHDTILYPRRSGRSQRGSCWSTPPAGW